MVAPMRRLALVLTLALAAGCASAQTDRGKVGPQRQPAQLPPTTTTVRPGNQDSVTGCPGGLMTSGSADYPVDPKGFPTPLDALAAWQQDGPPARLPKTGYTERRTGPSSLTLVHMSAAGNVDVTAYAETGAKGWRITGYTACA